MGNLRKINLHELEAVLGYLTASKQLDGLLYEEILELLKMRGFDVTYEDVFLLYEPEIENMKKETITDKDQNYSFDEDTGEFHEKELSTALEFMMLDPNYEDPFDEDDYPIFNY